MKEIDYARVTALARVRSIETLLNELHHYDGFLSPQEVAWRVQAAKPISELADSLRAKINLIGD